MHVSRLPLLALATSVAAQSCAVETFSNITVKGMEVLLVTATSHTNLTFGREAHLLQLGYFPANITNLDVCEVTVQYTTGQNDTINTVMWLPANWNGRFMSVGGGGWATGGVNISLARPAADGFAAITTDGGHSLVAPESEPPAWGLTSAGSVNWALLQNFAASSLDDAATLGKCLVKAYYGRPQEYSYWRGCSQGGRQGYMMAQRYPDQFDGILAMAPAINWNEFLLAEMWPQIIMNELGEYPTQCELDAMRQASIEACDGLDGVEDEIISLPGMCAFDAASAIGKTYTCLLTGENTTVTPAAATVANETWAGAPFWYGLTHGTTLDVLPNITCADGKCGGLPFSIPMDWISVFLEQDPEFDHTRINRTYLERLLRESKNRYESILGTADPDLTDFREAGGKMLSWHGLADQLIFPNGTSNYAQRVQALDAQASEYYRYFEAAGIAHCGTGPGWYPGNAFQQLIDWVEGGVAPDVLEAKAVPDLWPGVSDGAKELRVANLCLYPREMVYLGGDPNEAASFGCR